MIARFCTFFTFSLATSGHAQSCVENVVYKPQDVLNWLNKLEYSVDTEIVKNSSYSDFKHETTFACSEQFPNCKLLGLESYEVYSKEDGKFRIISYNNGQLVLRGQVNHEEKWSGVWVGLEKWFLHMNMTLVMNFEQGKLNGPVWRMKEENGFLVSDNADMDGQEVLYIYPGLQIGLYGHFSESQMVSAKPVKIEGFSCEHRMMSPLWSYISDDTYTYDPSGQDLSLHPTLKDPLESTWLEVQSSTIKGAGDGVFLKRDAPKNTIVGFFNGIRITLADTLKEEELKRSVHKMWNDWVSDELLYIPNEYIPINAYNATLGHKINHNSDANVDAGYIDHPRFGKIRSIVTTQDLKAGQEIFCQYAGTVDGATFVRQVFKDFSSYLDITETHERVDFLKAMQNGYQEMLLSMNHNPDDYYSKP